MRVVKSHDNQEGDAMQPEGRFIETEAVLVLNISCDSRRCHELISRPDRMGGFEFRSDFDSSQDGTATAASSLRCPLSLMQWCRDRPRIFSALHTDLMNLVACSCCQGVEQSLAMQLDRMCLRNLDFGSDSSLR